MSQDDFAAHITKAIGAHGAWKMRLHTAIVTGRSELQPSEVRRDDQCALGCWLHGPDIDAETRHGMPFKVVNRLHAEFHVCAADVLQLAILGRKPEATEVLGGEFKARSDKLVRALSKWKGEVQAT
jgi:hypothetical protein